MPFFYNNLGSYKKSIKQQRKERIKAWGLFAIIPLIGTVVGGSFIFTETQLNADKRLIRDCPKEKEDCPGRIEALERLAKAKRNLNDFNLSGANLGFAKLSGADLINANLSGADLISADLNITSLMLADLSNARLNFADLSNARLNFADLSNARLNFADLSVADLNFADLSNANLINARLPYANLEGANPKGANLEGAILIDSEGLDYSQIELACNWDKAIYKGHYDEEEEKWIVDREANDRYIKQLKQDKDSEPKEPVDCSKWEDR
ncbi:Pentapeptide repeat (fragment) [Hyella patelloides LEGE 07179]|uniref:Pentapeptide repeat n=1 Tax=Hyella patelloides LEGE 07179 TaxID=945734 RepID=A0A563VUT3_9CYAN